MSVRGAYDRGVCPVCRGEFALASTSGKIMPHGRSAAAPRGCPGVGQPPLRERRQAAGELPVSEIRPDTAADTVALPDLDMQVRVKRRDDDQPGPPGRPGPVPGGAA